MTRTILRTLVVVLVCFAVPQIAYAGESRDRPIDLVDRPGAATDEPIPLPDPITLPAPPAVDGVQLVGFTVDAFKGDRGVLTYARACQEVHAGSRMCTLEEINRTVNVPDPPGFRHHAWVQIPETLDPGAPNPRVRPRLDLNMNCKGWVSDSDRDEGMAIDLGERFGGCVPMSCDSALVVACCATLRE